MFDSSLAKGREPLEFQLGKGKVIKGNSLQALLIILQYYQGDLVLEIIKPLSQSCQSTALYSKKNKKCKIMSWWEHSLATIYKAWEHSSEHLTGNWFFFKIWFVENMEQVFLHGQSHRNLKWNIKLNLVTVNTYT